MQHLTLTPAIDEIATSRSLDIDEDFTTILVNDIFFTDNFHKKDPKVLVKYLYKLQQEGYKTIKARLFSKHIKFTAFKTVDGATI